MYYFFRIWRALINRLRAVSRNQTLVNKNYRLYNKALIKFLSIHFRQLIKNHQDNSESSTSKPSVNSEKIWIMWWQGLDSAPDVVKHCILSIQQHSKYHDVIVISKTNYQEYTHIPDWFMRRVEDGKIPFVKLSDVMRFDLIGSHGGIWMDATIFATQDFSDLFDGNSYFTSHQINSDDESVVSKNQWTGFLIGAHAGDSAMLFVRDFLLEYYKKYTVAVDYLLVDYIIRIADNERLGQFHQYIESTEESQRDLYKLVNTLSLPITPKENHWFSESKTFLFKLSWKRKYPTEQDGVPTYWGWIKKFGSVPRN